MSPNVYNPSQLSPQPPSKDMKKLRKNARNEWQIGVRTKEADMWFLGCLALELVTKSLLTSPDREHQHGHLADMVGKC